MPMMLGEGRLLPYDFEAVHDKLDDDYAVFDGVVGRYRYCYDQKTDANERDDHKGEHFGERLFDVAVVAGVHADDLHEYPDDEEHDLDCVLGFARGSQLLVDVDVDHHVEVDDVVVDIE